MRYIQLKIFVILIGVLLSGCMPAIHPPGDSITTGRLLSDGFLTEDGIVLPLRYWLPDQKPYKAVIIALHGFNDYSNFFQMSGEYFRQQSIASYAYDQRGFGASPDRGLWAGVDAYTDDLTQLVQLVSEQHPDLPIYLLGQSMGGAVVIVNLAQTVHPQVKGVILVAPAVWSRDTMPWYQQMVLWTLAHTTPWLTLTGEGVDVTPSDNIEMLRALARDPLVIKETRVETIYGLVNLMDAAHASTDTAQSPLLLLYGEKDDIIPKQPTYQFLLDLKGKSQAKETVAFYQNGYHMLLRDLQAQVTWEDINAWIMTSEMPLPSGADKRAEELLGAVTKKEIVMQAE
jgi:alpha-beta hydrolase superfamily lysophospholipase